MKRNAADLLHSRAGRMVLALLGAAALLVSLGGCGEFNDDPNPAGLSVSYQFDPDVVNRVNGATSSPFAITPCTGCEPVHTVIVGAIVIRHANGDNCSTTSPTSWAAGQICPYTRSAQVSGTNEDRLEDDAEQSIQYLSLSQIADGTTTVSFAIPPRNAGFWQLIGVGLRKARTGIDDVEFDTDATWYGFTENFLNGTVSAGGTASTLTLRPWCEDLVNRDATACAP